MASLPLRRALGAVIVAAGLAACAGTVPEGSLATTAPNGAAERVPATVVRPDGPGPFPAVVILHDCSGFGPRSSGAPARWSRELVARGYVVVIPDSFTTRGFPEGLCTDASRSRGEVAPARRVVDAYAALAQARALPFVDGRRVGVPTEHPVEIVVYPGAHHSFDSDRPVRFVASRVNMNAPGGRGAATGGDPRAWADSIRRVTEFFERTLR